MSVKQRLTAFAKSKEKSVRQFEINCGLTIGYINAIRVSIQPDKIQSIASCYPDLNTEWLLTGEGEMLKPAKNRFSQMSEQEIEEVTTETFAEELMRLYKSGEVYPREVHERIVADKTTMIAERDKRIEELQRKVWDLEKQLERKK